MSTELDRVCGILSHALTEHRFLVATVRAAVAAADRGEPDPMLRIREWLSGHRLYPRPGADPAKLAGQGASLAIKSWTWRCLLCGVYGADRPAEPASEAHLTRWHSPSQDVAEAVTTTEQETRREKEGGVSDTNRGPGPPSPTPREATGQEVPLWT